jgi:hypothetical protein
MIGVGVGVGENHKEMEGVDGWVKEWGREASGRSNKQTRGGRKSK